MHERPAGLYASSGGTGCEFGASGIRHERQQDMLTIETAHNHGSVGNSWLIVRIL